jgi:hypothetical protein
MATGGGVLLLSDLAGGRRHAPRTAAAPIPLARPAPAALSSSWPDAHAFREAVQDLTTAAADPELAVATVAADRFGLPVAYTGRFAVVFRVRIDGAECALRCFTTGAGHEERADRYRLLEERLSACCDLLGDGILPFRYLDAALRVGGVAYPALLMPWADGVPLGAFVEAHHNDPAAMTRLADALDGLLARLERAGVAHGDWQHDNLLVGENSRRVTLVDYDGLHIAGMERHLLLPAPEVGHPNYQHPGRGPEHAGVGVDRFAHAALTAALRALARDPSLWTRFGGAGDDCVLFGREDYAAPDASPVFAAVSDLARGDGALASSLNRLRRLCALPAPEVRSSAAPPAVPWYRLGIEEAVAAAVPAGGITARVRTDGGAQPAPARLGYRERLDSPVERERERQNLRALRAFAAASAPAVAGLWGTASAVEGANGAVWFLAALLTACVAYWTVAGFYLAWPRRRLADELTLELGRLRHERARLAGRAARLRADADRARTSDAAPRPDAREARRRAEDDLRHVPISRALRVAGVTAASVREARALGIDTALGLHRRGTSAGLYDALAPEQAALLRAWCRRLLAHHEAVHRDALTPGVTEERAAAALDARAAEIDARLSALAEERASLPPPTLGVYLRRAAGETARAVLALVSRRRGTAA